MAVQDGNGRQERRVVTCLPDRAPLNSVGRDVVVDIELSPVGPRWGETFLHKAFDFCAGNPYCPAYSDNIDSAPEYPGPHGRNLESYLVSKLLRG